MKIWVDDIREPPIGWIWASSSRATIAWLEVWKRQGVVIDVMSLDHDLGGDDTTRPIVLWMCENEFWPVEVRVHSANPPGVYWLESMISRYHPTGATNPERYKTMIPYPAQPDELYKFKRSEGVCATGEPVLDSAQLFSGEMCCSSCRRTMHIENDVWTHD